MPISPIGHTFRDGHHIVASGCCCTAAGLVYHQSTLVAMGNSMSADEDDSSHEKDAVYSFERAEADRDHFVQRRGDFNGWENDDDSIVEREFPSPSRSGGYSFSPKRERWTDVRSVEEEERRLEDPVDEPPTTQRRREASSSPAASDWQAKLRASRRKELTGPFQANPSFSSYSSAGKRPEGDRSANSSRVLVNISSVDEEDESRRRVPSRQEYREEECKSYDESRETRDEDRRHSDQHARDERSLLDDFDESLVEMKSLSRDYEEETDSPDNVDMQFVEQYEEAFNAFLMKYPQLASQNPRMMNYIRIAKLKTFLEGSTKIESNLMKRSRQLKEYKEDVADWYHSRLIDATSEKASKDLHLQRELRRLERKATARQGRATWDMISMCHQRMVKEQEMEAQCNAIPELRNIYDLVPSVPEASELRHAMRPSAQDSRLSTANVDQVVERLRSENAFLTAEVSVLEKKLAAQQQAGKKYSWVDSVMLQMDEERMRKLKKRFQKKLKVSF